MGKDKNKKQMCLILLIEIWNYQIVTSLHWFFKPKCSASRPFWHALNGKMYEVQIRKPKTGSSCDKSLSTVLSHLFAHPSFSQQVKEANKLVLVNPHRPWLLCAVDQQRGTLLQDRRYTAECFSKEFDYTKAVRSGCTLGRSEGKVGGKEGWVSFVWGLGFFVWLCYFLPSPFLCCYKWQLNTFCPHITRCAYASTYRGKTASEFH